MNEGSFGQFEQEEEKLEYSLKTTLDRIVQGDWSHQIKIGAGYGHYEAYWKRNQNSYWYVGNGNLKGQSCVNANGIRYDGCDEALTNNNLQGQYFTTRTVYGAGELNIQQDRWHAYIEDTIKWNNTFFTTLGVRSDYDSITKETNLAPRSSFTYQPFNSPLLRLTTGWNRYYGLNTFANKLQANKRLLQTTETRTGVDKAWKTTAGSQYGQMSHLSKLESPISNEKLFAISGQAQNIDWSIKWVNRENKKMLRQSEWEENAKPEGKGNYTTYYYENTGISKSDIFTVAIKNIEPLNFANSTHYLSLAADYTDSFRNFNNYESLNINPNETIYYDGNYINSSDQPADNFNTPWTVRLGWDIGLNNLPLNISNFISYRSSQDVMRWISKDHPTNSHQDENGNSYHSWTPYKNKSAFSWDLRTTYKLPIAKQYEGVVGLTINNVTNRHNTITNTDGSLESEIGRQFIADVTFKF